MTKIGAFETKYSYLHPHNAKIFAVVKELGKEMKTSARPDTRPSVADGWAGAEMQLFATRNVLERWFSHFSTGADGPTDQRTNGRMDRRTDGQSLL